MYIYMYKLYQIRLTAAFSIETMKAGGSGMTYSKYWKENNCQPRIFYQAKLSLKKMKAKQLKTKAKQKLKEFVASTPPYKKC